jgi:3-hydroxyisobutyrate dehydrogenase-like beta-hydroxyacid dehydrogenase
VIQEPLGPFMLLTRSSFLVGELDTLISSTPHSHLITCPVFGTPAVADKSQLLIIMSGDYHSKKEVAYLLVPAVGRKVVDLGKNLEKGSFEVKHFKGILLTLYFT